MEPKSFFKPPKFINIKVLLISLSAALTLWIWGVISTQDLINKTIANFGSTPENTIQVVQTSATPELRKVQLPASPTPAPSTSNPALPKQPRSVPLTNTGSSRP